MQETGDRSPQKSRAYIYVHIQGFHKLFIPKCAPICSASFGVCNYNGNESSIIIIIPTDKILC